MRYIIALALAIVPTIARAQWYSGGRYSTWRHRPYHSYSAQTVYLPNATFYQDSYGNSGMSVWSGNARFDTFQFRRPVYSPWWW